MIRVLTIMQKESSPTSQRVCGGGGCSRVGGHTCIYDQILHSLHTYDMLWEGGNRPVTGEET